MPIDKKKRSWLWPAVILVALAAGGYWWWHGHSAPTGAAPGAGAGRAGGRAGGAAGVTQPPTPVRIEAAKTDSMDVFIRSLGTVTAYNTATVRSKVDGELQKILFREGQQVKAGDALAQIDPATYKVALEQAEGTLEQNKAQLDNARKDLQRYQTLYSQDSIARQQVDTQAALVRQYEGTLKTNQAAVDNARLQLGYTRVIAPIAGRLGLRQVDLGNIVHTSDTTGIVIITQTQPISVIFSIAETDLPAVLKQLRGGHTLPVMAYDRADLVHLTDGTLATVDNQIDVTTGTVRLKAAFENKDESLFPNQFVNARLRVDRMTNVTVIPAGAVQRGTPGTFVYTVGNDNVVHVRVLKLGPTDGDRIVVLDGLKPGENVITEGVDRLREGSKVQIVTGSAEAAPPAAPALGPGQRGQRRTRQSGSAS